MPTLFDKLWQSHVVREARGEPTLLYIDLHLIHEVTSPQAFDGLRQAGRKVRRPDLTFGTVDHNVPTTDRSLPIADAIAAKQVETLRRNCNEFGVQLYDINSPEQGIVHVIGPELGLTRPGMTIVCGDSHTSTHGAFGALAFGIGTSEVEHVLATQCLPQNKPLTMKVETRGALPEGVTAKDLALGIIGKIGTDGATGCVIEYAGDAVRSLSMEGRMTLCNMSIEAGARAGMVAPDETTFAYLQGRRFSSEGDVNYWAHTSRHDRGPHDINGPSGVIGHVEGSTEISDNSYLTLGFNFLVKSTGAVRVFAGAGLGLVMQDETFSQQQFGCSPSIPMVCNKFENHYDRAFPQFRLLGGVEVPVTSRLAIVGSARYENQSWEETSRNVSAIAGVRFGLK